ncbi:hypothetical protein [Corallococcus llansteffanensis]|uniref:Lipoprotein n=1 Tax=Corallococcus llansteffanensis TaxID=2316731 RepID=A0A3A8Q2F9_9BACT|nr:hypothetical protein [Corallococcus llansteffanensis]RKH61120.1 hypothetical protein D7V93_12190 [Corallococcus llansteffanensis]
MKRLVVSALVLASLTGCFRMSVRSPAPRDGAPEGQMGASFVGGLTTSNVAAGECRHGLSRVDVYWPWWSPIVYVFTFGVVAPLRAEYVCAQGPDSAASDAEVPPSVPAL